MSKRDYQFFVYIMSSISQVLYIGVTNELFARVQEHKQDVNDGYTKKYRCHKLVYFEEFQYIDQAIAREKQMKKWRREKKEALINEANPHWRDLSLDWYVEAPDFSARSTPIPSAWSK